jgi:hypothetical protein
MIVINHRIDLKDDPYLAAIKYILVEQHLAVHNHDLEKSSFVF